MCTSRSRPTKLVSGRGSTIALREETADAYHSMG
jgi:hypothetical protein